MTREELDHITIEAKDWAEFDKKVSEFSRTHIIRSQIDHGHILEGKDFVKVWGHVFYMKREISKESTGAPVDIPVEEEKNYLIKCAVCSAFFNFLKYPRCSGAARHGVEGVPDELKERYNKIWGRK